MEQERGSTDEWTDPERVFAVELGKRLALLRRLGGRSAEQLAELADVTPSHVHYAESASADLALMDVRRILLALGLSDWTEAVRIAEHRAGNRETAPRSTSIPLHIHVEIRDEGAVAAALQALMSASLVDGRKRP